SAVTCPTACTSDGGAWVAPMAWVPIKAESLVVSSSATLMAPEADGDRWLVIHARVKNPWPRAVMASAPSTQTFSFVLSQAGSAAQVQDFMSTADSSAYFFAPTETKEFLFELRVGDDFTRYSVPPGDYTFAVGFGSNSSAW